MKIKKFKQLGWSCLFLVIMISGCSQPAAVIPAATQSVTTAPTETAVEPAISIWQAMDVGELQFSPGATSMELPGNLQPNSAIRFTVTALQGQQMSMWLTTEPPSMESPQATLFITDASGTVLSSDPEAYWSQVLPEDQTYTIEIRSLAENNILFSFKIEIPVETIDPSMGTIYEPMDISVCQLLKEEAAAALNAEVTLESYAPFLDAVGGEAGQGCRLTASGTGANFSDPRSIISTLINTVGIGWTQAQDYSADGVTGSTVGLYRDMGLMLIKVNWKPDPAVVCPADQPLDACGLVPEQKIYAIEINLAQSMANFSIDGHWVDASSGFTLDLYQDWKQIFGQHVIVAQNGNKIDSMEASINGWLKNEVATVQFQSSFTDQPGMAEITYIDVNTIQWKIVAPPAGEYYLPMEASLTRSAQ